MSHDNWRVHDLHPNHVFAEFDRLMQLDLDDLLLSRPSFRDTCCPACHSNRVDHAFTYQRLNYRRCQECEMLYISPAPTEDQHLEFVKNSRAMAFWRECQSSEMQAARLPMYQERVAFTSSTWKALNLKPKSVLELGAGNGEFAELLAAQYPELQIVLLEPQCLNLNVPSIKIIHEGFAALENADHQFDSVIAWELIEHILEPDEFLKLVLKVLKPGSPLVLSTPNERSVETRKLKTESTNIMFDHVRLYNPKAIRLLLERNGFRVVEISTPGKLDLERISAYQSSCPKAFEEDPCLRLILDNPKTADAFQAFLQSHLLSSHMRIIAVANTVWQESTTPHL